MEYISREAVLEHLNKCKEDPLFDPDMAKICFAISIFIENMQAADVQPVHHGRWIEVTPKHSRCSVCDTTCLIAVYPISKGANFCPNCGARMDGDTNE